MEPQITQIGLREFMERKSMPSSGNLRFPPVFSALPYSLKGANPIAQGSAP